MAATPPPPDSPSPTDSTPQGGSAPASRRGTVWLWTTIVLLAVVVVVAAVDSGRNGRVRQLPEVPGGEPPGRPATLDLAGLRAAYTGVPSVLSWEVMSTMPADPDLFVQGLELLDDGRLLVSSGRYGQSRVAVVDPARVAHPVTVDLPDDVFAEGATVVGAGDDTRIVVLTWREQEAFLLDRDLNVVATVPYPDTEGWGVCNLGDGHLVTSDGSATLVHRRFPQLDARRSVTVRRAGEELAGLNELECVDGVVWANVWQTDSVVAIDPDRGDVLAEVDLTGALPARRAPGADVTNGIAAVGGDQFWFAGKLWDRWYRVRLFSPGVR